jgi:hypothetical protein
VNLSAREVRVRRLDPDPPAPARSPSACADAIPVRLRRRDPESEDDIEGAALDGTRAPPVNLPWFARPSPRDSVLKARRRSPM